MSTNYKYLIVGGGTAGLTVASRLTEDPAVAVLVIEAGPDNREDPLVYTPGLFVGTYGNPKYDWNFISSPQKHLNGKVIAQPRGKQLGGSSAVNTMMTVYPSRKSIDTWAEVGNEGWNYDSMKPYFQKFATVHAPSQSVRDIVGITYHDDSVVGDGPVQVSFGDGYGAINTAWMETFKEFGLEVTDDVREGAAMGAFQQPSTIDPKTKTRSYAASAYLANDVSSRPNLTIMTDSVVKKIIFDQSGPEPVAQGVVVLGQDGVEQVFECTEVILAAGSLQTPQILELSGIGSRKLLESHGIPIIVDNPNVGENLQDHPLACQALEVNPETPSSDILRDPTLLAQLVGQYQADRSGPMGSLNITVAYAPLADGSGIKSAEERSRFLNSFQDHIKTEDEKLLLKLLESGDEPSAQYLLFPGQIDASLPNPDNMASYLAPARPENFVSIITVLNHPFSRGSIHITSPDVNVLPKWDPNFCSHPLDLEITALNAQFIDRLVHTEPFAKLLKSDGVRIPDIKSVKDDLDSARKLVQDTNASLFHPSGSCGMRPRDQGGVVDSRLRVYGVKGLRVVDASIFPLEPLGNIMTVVYAVAEKAADLIKEDMK